MDENLNLAQCKTLTFKETVDIQENQIYVEIASSRTENINEPLNCETPRRVGRLIVADLGSEVVMYMALAEHVGDLKAGVKS